MKRLLVFFLLVASVVIIAGSVSFEPVQAANKDYPSVTLASKKGFGGKLTALNFNDSIRSLYNAIGLAGYNLKFEVFRYGMMGYHSLSDQNKLSDKRIVSFIDFTLPSTEKRFYTIDLDQRKVLFHSLVSHGRNTGEDMANSFSNVPHSNQSSMGFYLTGETYFGNKGYSMRLDGMDGDFNDNMRRRAVVMHDAKYVSEEWIRKYGRLGRSQGCPALPKQLAKRVIDTIRDKTMIFAYFNDSTYLSTSQHLRMEALFPNVIAEI